MTNPYGWSVVPRLLVKRERWPGSAQTQSIPLVYPGQEVLPDQPVLRRELSPHEDVASSVQQQNSLPQRTSGQFALSAASSVAFVHSSLSSGERLNNIEFPAGLHGRVVGFTGRGGVVIESKVALVQGALGAGNQVAGVLAMWRAGGVGYVPHTIPPGALLVVPGPLSFTLLHRALSSGVSGIIASSIALHDLEGFLRTDFLQLLRAEDTDQAQAQLPPLTLLLTEGIGTMIMPAHVMNLLHHYEGSIALLSGVTSLRYNLYPELLISLPLLETQKDWQPQQLEASLALNAQVRICNGERKGAIGIIDYFFVYPQLFRSGLRARAARLRMPDGSFFVAPCCSLERIG